MTTSKLLRYLRTYANLAQRNRVSYIQAVKALVLAWFAKVSEGVTDPNELDALRNEVAVYVVREYAYDDPNREPTSTEVVAWLLPQDEPL